MTDPGWSGPETRSRNTSKRCKAVALVWPLSPTERAKAFEVWQKAAMHCLRGSPLGFDLIIALRTSLRLDGTILATNAELARATESYSSKVIGREVGLLKTAGLLKANIASLKSVSGARRIIRLSMPLTDEGGAT
jgi:hypothetical protein